MKSNRKEIGISPDDYNFELPETGDQVFIELSIKLELMIPDTQNIQ